MAQALDLGVQSFKKNHSEECLLSRATATLMFEDNNRKELSADRPSNLNNVWVTMKQELVVDLHIEVYLDPTTTESSFVKQALKTVQNSPICCNPHLTVSRISHEYHGFADMTTLRVSITLCRAPDQLLQNRPWRLPRRVKGYAVDPHPPPEIVRAALSNITIRMKSLRHYTPWNLLLTRLWLKDFLDTPLLEDGENNVDPKKGTCIVSLRPFRPSMSLSSGNSKAVSEHTECPGTEKSLDLKELFGYAIQSVFSGSTWPHRGEMDKVTFEQVPKIFDIAPVLFKPGHYENLRQRAGLLPVVTKSMNTIFRSCPTSRVNQKLFSIENLLNTRYNGCVSTEGTDRSNDFRSLTKCAIWTALQRNIYKIKRPNKLMFRNPSMVLSSDDILLTEESDLDDEFDEDLISSTEGSVTTTNDILPDEDTEIEQDSGYSSLQSLQKIPYAFLDIDHFNNELGNEFTSDESVICEQESDLESVSSIGERETIASSFSLAPSVLSNMFMEDEVADEPLFYFDATNQNDTSEDNPDDVLMDDTSSVSILASSI